MSEKLNEKQLDELATPCWSYDHHSFDHVSFARSVLHATLSQPAPQGVAEVMALVGEYWAIAYTEGLEQRKHDTPAGDAQRVLSAITNALTAIVQERDALQNDKQAMQKSLVALGGNYAETCEEYDTLKARVAELEGDVARDAARYKFLRHSDWLDEFVMESHGIRPGISETLDVAIDAAIAAAKEPNHG